MATEVQTLTERISEIAQRWFLTEPLLFAAYCTHSTEENLQMKVPMRCGKGRIEYQPELLKDTSYHELADRLKVEAMRILLKHPYQRQPYQARPEILYLASNMTILGSMGGAGMFCFELVPQDIVAKLPRRKTFEEYYKLLDKMFPSQKDSDSPKQSGNSENSESSEDSKITPDINAEAAELWEEDSLTMANLNQKIKEALAFSKGRGTLPDSVIEIVEASLVPPINVEALLCRFKRSLLIPHRHLTRMRPSRRYGFEQMGSHYSYTAQTRLLVAVDVSGSVTTPMLSNMLGLVNRIFKRGIAAIDIVQFDASLKLPVQPLEEAMSKVKIVGRGGTDFQLATNYYLAHPEYDGLIFITDGEAPAPEVSEKEKSARPVVWIITNDSGADPAIRHGWKLR